MKISTYITTINSLFYQSTLEATIRQSLLFSDEVVIANSINSSDGTTNLLNSLKDEYGKENGKYKIQIYTYNEPSVNEMSKEEGRKLLADRRTFALKKCTGDYCILQDDDEMIHEKYINDIRRLPEKFPDTIAFRFNTLHFYRSFDLYQGEKDWYQKKIYMIKNLDVIKHGEYNGDIDNFVIKDKSLLTYVSLDGFSSPDIVNTSITSYHYGWCRNDAIFMIKRYYQEIQWNGPLYWNEHKLPLKFDNGIKLKRFDDKDKSGHPMYMKDIIRQEKKYNSRWIDDFTEEWL